MVDRNSLHAKGTMGWLMLCKDRKGSWVGRVGTIRLCFGRAPSTSYPICTEDVTIMDCRDQPDDRRDNRGVEKSLKVLTMQD